MRYADKVPSRVQSGTVRSVPPHLGANGGFTLTPRPGLWAPPTDNNVVAGIGQVFDDRLFAVPQAPVDLGRQSVSAKDLPDELAVWTMAIQLPGGASWVPNELAPLRPMLEFWLGVEGLINPNIGESYVYLTVHNTLVEAGEPQRPSGPHSDCIQGPGIQPNQPADHAILWSNTAPTLFYTDGFDMSGVSAKTHLLDDVFSRQVGRMRPLTHPPGTMLLVGPYCVHQAAPVPGKPGEWVRRLMVRLNVSQWCWYNRLGNTINEGIMYEGLTFEPRPIPDGLIRLPL